MGKKIKESSTTAGSVAPVAQSMHTNKRSIVGQGVYGGKKGGSMFTGKKTNKKFANSAPVLESEDLEEGIFDVFKNTDNKKSRKVAVSTDDEEGKISFSDLGKNAMFDPNDKRVTDDQRMFYEFMLSQKNKADSTDFINAINHYIRKYKEASRKEGGSNPHNSGRLKVLNYLERQLAKQMPIQESDLSEELIAKKLAQDFKSFSRPKDREISKRSKDREILPKQEFSEVAAAPIAKAATATAGSMGSRLIPGLGLALGGYDAYDRAKKGDYIGAGLSGLGAVTSLVPGIGTAASLGLAGAQLARDYTKKTGAFAPDEKEQQAAADANKTSTAALAPSQVSVAAPAAKPKAAPRAEKDPTIDPYNPASDKTLQAGNREVAAAPAPSNFKQAFAAARQGGEGTFTYNGKEYNTQLAEQALTKMKKIKPTIKQDKLTPHEKFKGSVKRAGYDMDAGANRLLKLLDKQAKERAERDSEGVNEWVSRREEFNPQPAVSTFESADNVKTFRVTLVDRLTDEPKTVTIKASSNEEAESKAEKQHSGYDVRGSRKIAEGAKVDRMVKHIEKSERATGKDKKEAENIAWATANKRGYLDNKNKKKHVAEGRVKDIAMAIHELTHEGKTPGQIAKELDIPLMIVLKFKAQMDKQGIEEAANPAQQAAIAINMKKHHQKPKNESHDSDEYDDESGMAHNQLENIARAVHGLGDTIQEGDNLPEWVQKKLTLAEDHLITIWNYLQSEKSDEIMEQGVAEGKADPVGSWVVYDGSKVKRFKSREGAKAYAEKNGGKVASSEHYADKIQKQGVAEGLGKDIKRAAQGWGSPQDKPADIVKRNKGYDTDTAKKVRAHLDDAPEHSPAGLQKRVLDRKLKGVEEGYIPIIVPKSIKEPKTKPIEVDIKMNPAKEQGMRDAKQGKPYKNPYKFDKNKSAPENADYRLYKSGYKSAKEGVSEAQQCPECGGAAYDNEMLAEKQDACYSKVKSRYKVWPSAYASGALVKCRKVGAKNWGNKSKK